MPLKMHNLCVRRCIFEKQPTSFYIISFNVASENINTIKIKDTLDNNIIFETVWAFLFRVLVFTFISMINLTFFIPQCKGRCFMCFMVFQFLSIQQIHALQSETECARLLIRFFPHARHRAMCQDSLATSTLMLFLNLWLSRYRQPTC